MLDLAHSGASRRNESRIDTCSCFIRLSLISIVAVDLAGDGEIGHQAVCLRSHGAPPGNTLCYRCQDGEPSNAEAQDGEPSEALAKDGGEGGI
jgi:hypothetical protein